MTTTVYGLTIDELPEHTIPLETITLVKALDEDSDPVLIVRSTNGLSGWERIGILTLALDHERGCAQVHVEDEPPEENQEP